MMPRWAIVVGVCILIVGVLFAQISGRYSAYPDAIRADLRAQGVAVRSVEVLHMWPDTVNTITYGANVRVMLTSGALYWGRLECRGWQKKCAYRLASLQQDWRPLADLVAQPAWWDWLQHYMYIQK